MQLRPDDFRFRIDLWDDADKRIEQVIAIAFVSDLEVALAAYNAGVPYGLRRPRHASQISCGARRTRCLPSTLRTAGYFRRVACRMQEGNSYRAASARCARPSPEWRHVAFGSRARHAGRRIDDMLLLPYCSPFLHLITNSRDETAKLVPRIVADELRLGTGGNFSRQLETFI
jgi:hypothetical protein